jgi:hypothetical protein
MEFVLGVVETGDHNVRSADRAEYATDDHLGVSPVLDHPFG